MKNAQNGFAIIPLVIVLALLVIGGGVYMYINKKVETPVTADTRTQQSNQIQQQVDTQTPPVNTQINTSNKNQTTRDKEIFIFVDENIYNALTSKIERLASDIENDLGSKVIIQHALYTNPVDIRNILKQSYMGGKLAGSILIGNIPTFSRKDGFYTDWFYSDLNDSCPMDKNGVFETSLACNTLNVFSKRDVFVGRISPAVNSPSSTAKIESYLNKDHDFRQGKIVFPKKLLVYPSVNIISVNNGSAPEKNSLPTNMKIAINSQDRYSQQETDVIYESDYIKQKQEYLTKLQNNRYESALINIHGSDNGQFPSGQFDGSQITSSDISKIKPNIMYIALLSCSNGAFKSPGYLAGELLFNGDTLLVTANSQPAGIGNFASDPPTEPVFFQPLSFLNSSAPLGQMFIHDQSLYITQVFGDPTLQMTENKENLSLLEVKPSLLDFGVVSSEAKPKTLSIKNIGQEKSTILILPPWGSTIDNKPFYDPKEAVSPLPRKNYFGFISDKTENGFFKKIILSPGESTSFSFSFSPATKKGEIIRGKYNDSFLLLTSDQLIPYLDIPVSAYQE